MKISSQELETIGIPHEFSHAIKACLIIKRHKPSLSDKRAGRGICVICQKPARKATGKFCLSCWIKRKKKKFKNGLLQRFDNNFIFELEQLKTNPFTTLDEVGQGYGITRERVRQIFNKFFYPEKYGKYNRVKSATLQKEIASMGCKYDPRHHKQDMKTPRGRGTIGEIAVLKKCQELGYQIRFGTNGVTIDMNINGFLVDVKMCSYPTKTNHSQVFYYRWGVSVKQINLCDFFICYAKNIDIFFIIPNHFPAKTKPTMIYHRATMPRREQYAKMATESMDQSKYKEAWHLLTTTEG